MDALLISAASGMKARIESLDMLGNNIANSETAGFKADREFYNLYHQELPVIEGKWTDLSQGSVIPSGNPLDLALSGTGFFTLNSPAGVEYTRNGTFTVSKANQLATPDGRTLRNARDQGRAITVDPARPIVIDKQGVVSQDGQEIGQIEIAQVRAAAGSLAKLGNSYFSLSNPLQADATPAASAGTEILQGQLEQSNVSPADSAVRMVGVLRQFEMLQRAMRIGEEMNKQMIQDVAHG